MRTPSVARSLGTLLAASLVMFTGDPHKMGPFANPPWVKVLAWTVAIIIAVLNVYLLYQTFTAGGGG